MRAMLVIWIVVLFAAAASIPLLSDYSAGKKALTPAIQQSAPANEIITRTFTTQAEADAQGLQALQEKVLERNRRAMNDVEDEPYIPDNCDTSSRPRMYIQMHCTDKDF